MHLLARFSAHRHPSLAQSTELSASHSALRLQGFLTLFQVTYQDSQSLLFLLKLFLSRIFIRSDVYTSLRALI